MSTKPSKLLFHPKKTYKYGFLAVILVIGAYFSTTPNKVLAGANIFDGGVVLEQESQCSCSGGNTVRVKSAVDNSTHVYLYDPKVTQLDMNFDINTSGAFFLTTLVPVAVCLDSSEECYGTSGQSPEGEFLEVGTSFNRDPSSFFALIGQPANASIPTDVKSQLFSLLGDSAPWKNLNLPTL